MTSEWEDITAIIWDDGTVEELVVPDPPDIEFKKQEQAFEIKEEE